MSDNEREEKKFRLDARGVFGTWPKCDKTAADAFLAMKLILRRHDVWKNLKRMHFVSEFHLDGTAHIHGFFQLSKRWNIRGHDTLNLDIDGKNYQGNYKALRNLGKACLYLCKTGHPLTSYVSEGLKTIEYLAALERAKRSHQSKGLFATAAQLIQEARGDVAGCLEWNPGFTLQHLSCMDRFGKMIASMIPPPVLPTLPREIFHDNYVNNHDNEIADWVHKNFMQGPRGLKQEQLYLYGPTGTGKTSFVRNLLRYYHDFVPSGVRWQDHWRPRYFGVIVMEEFSDSWLPFKLLLKLSAGEKTEMPIRNHASAWNTENLPMILTSNNPIDAWYHGKSDAECTALAARFKVVFVPEGSQIQFLWTD